MCESFRLIWHQLVTGLSGLMRVLCRHERRRAGNASGDGLVSTAFTFATPTAERQPMLHTQTWRHPVIELRLPLHCQRMANRALTPLLWYDELVMGLCGRGPLQTRPVCSGR